jgi:hypothetical protein
MFPCRMLVFLRAPTDLRSRVAPGPGPHRPFLSHRPGLVSLARRGDSGRVTVDRPESDVAAPSGHHSTLSFSKVGRADPHAVLREAAASKLSLRAASGAVPDCPLHCSRRELLTS